MQTATSPLKHAEKLDQCENKQEGDRFSQNMVANNMVITTESVTSDMLMEIKAMKLVLETLVAGQVCEANSVLRLNLCTYNCVTCRKTLAFAINSSYPRSANKLLSVHVHIISIFFCCSLNLFLLVRDLNPISLQLAHHSE